MHITKTPMEAINPPPPVPSTVLVSSSALVPSTLHSLSRRWLLSLLLRLVTAAAAAVVLSNSNIGPAFADALDHVKFGASRVIRPMPCKHERTAEEGICMFAWDCLSRNGTHITFCRDRFYYGSCCRLPDGVEPPNHADSAVPAVPSPVSSMSAVGSETTAFANRDNEANSPQRPFGGSDDHHQRRRPPGPHWSAVAATGPTSRPNPQQQTSEHQKPNIEHQQPQFTSHSHKPAANANTQQQHHQQLFNQKQNQHHGPHSQQANQSSQGSSSTHQHPSQHQASHSTQQLGSSTLQHLGSNKLPQHPEPQHRYPGQHNQHSSQQQHSPSTPHQHPTQLQHYPQQQQLHAFQHQQDTSKHPNYPNYQHRHPEQQHSHLDEQRHSTAKPFKHTSQHHNYPDQQLVPTSQQHQNLNKPVDHPTEEPKDTEKQHQKQDEQQYSESEKPQHTNQHLYPVQQRPFSQQNHGTNKPGQIQEQPQSSSQDNQSPDQQKLGSYKPPKYPNQQPQDPNKQQSLFSQQQQSSKKPIRYPEQQHQDSNQLHQYPDQQEHSFYKPPKYPSQQSSNKPSSNPTQWPQYHKQQPQGLSDQHQNSAKPLQYPNAQNYPSQQHQHPTQQQQGFDKPPHDPVKQDYSPSLQHQNLPTSPQHTSSPDSSQQRHRPTQQHQNSHQPAQFPHRPQEPIKPQHQYPSRPTEHFTHQQHQKPYQPQQSLPWSPPANGDPYDSKEQSGWPATSFVGGLPHRFPTARPPVVEVQFPRDPPTKPTIPPAVPTLYPIVPPTTQRRPIVVNNHHKKQPAYQPQLSQEGTDHNSGSAHDTTFGNGSGNGSSGVVGNNKGHTNISSSLSNSNSGGDDYEHISNIGSDNSDADASEAPTQQPRPIEEAITMAITEVPTGNPTWIVADEADKHGRPTQPAIELGGAPDGDSRPPILAQGSSADNQLSQKLPTRAPPVGGIALDASVRRPTPGSAKPGSTGAADDSTTGSDVANNPSAFSGRPDDAHTSLGVAATGSDGDKHDTHNATVNEVAPADDHSDFSPAPQRPMTGSTNHRPSLGGLVGSSSNFPTVNGLPAASSQVRPASPDADGSAHASSAAASAAAAGSPLAEQSASSPHSPSATSGNHDRGTESTAGGAALAGTGELSDENTIDVTTASLPVESKPTTQRVPTRYPIRFPPKERSTTPWPLASPVHLTTITTTVAAVAASSSTMRPKVPTQTNPSEPTLVQPPATEGTDRPTSGQPNELATRPAQNTYDDANASEENVDQRTTTLPPQTAGSGADSSLPNEQENDFLPNEIPKPDDKPSRPMIDDQNATEENDGGIATTDEDDDTVTKHSHSTTETGSAVTDSSMTGPHDDMNDDENDSDSQTDSGTQEDDKSAQTTEHTSDVLPPTTGEAENSHGDQPFETDDDGDSGSGVDNRLTSSSANSNPPNRGETTTAPITDELTISSHNDQQHQHHPQPTTELDSTTKSDAVTSSSTRDASTSSTVTLPIGTDSEVDVGNDNEGSDANDPSGDDDDRTTTTTTASPTTADISAISDPIRAVCGRPRSALSSSTSSSRLLGRIVGGDLTRFGRWPWMISLRQYKKNAFVHKCGAALLNEHWAVSAAHCVHNVSPNDILLRLGEYDLSGHDREPLGHVERRVQIVATHPKFDAHTFEYDLALMRFYDPVALADNIIPVCVAEGNQTYVGRQAVVTGWGRLYEDGPLPSVLQKVSVPIITNRECERMYRKAGFIEDIPDIFICAGLSAGGKDSCEGDSGGPLVLKDEASGQWNLIGVISWGIGCALPNQPGVYTRITKFADWIRQIIAF